MCSYLGISCLNILFNAGKNHIPDGCGSGHATVGQLEILTHNHQLQLLSNLCNKSDCIIMCIYIVMLYIVVPTVMSGKSKRYLVFEVILR